MRGILRALTIGGRGVDSDHDPGEKTVGQVIAKVDVVENGVRGGVFRLLRTKDVIIGVGGECDSILGVGASRLDLSDEVLVPEKLANVRDGAAAHWIGLSAMCPETKFSPSGFQERIYLHQEIPSGGNMPSMPAEHYAYGTKKTPVFTYECRCQAR